MNLTYAIADLHGAQDLLELALAAIDKHAAAAPDGSRTVVFLGDYIDRGPNSPKLVERLIRGPNDGWNWICLKGNHEDMMSKAIGVITDTIWYENGGSDTMFQYLQAGISDREHASWMKSLPEIHYDEFRIFVHAGLDPVRSLDEQISRDLMYRAEIEVGNLGAFGRHVVHGHTPHIDGPIKQKGRTNLDTAAWKLGRLAVAVFDDDKAGGPVDILEVLRSAG